MLAPLISCLLQSISLNELFNQISFLHKIEITLSENNCNQLLNSHQATEMAGRAQKIHKKKLNHEEVF